MPVSSPNEPLTHARMDTRTFLRQFVCGMRNGRSHHHTSSKTNSSHDCTISSTQSNSIFMLQHLYWRRMKRTKLKATKKTHKFHNQCSRRRRRHRCCRQPSEFGTQIRTSSASSSSFSQQLFCGVRILVGSFGFTHKTLQP